MFTVFTAYDPVWLPIPWQGNLSSKWQRDWTVEQLKKCCQYANMQ